MNLVTVFDWNQDLKPIGPGGALNIYIKDQLVTDLNNYNCVCIAIPGFNLFCYLNTKIELMPF